MQNRKPSSNRTSTLGGTALVLLAGLIPLAATAQSGKVAKVNLAPLLGKPVEAYEKALGKPFKTTDENGGPSSAPDARRWFKPAGFKQIICPSTKEGSDHLYVSYIVAYFPKGSVPDWKIALAKVGIPSAGVVTKPATGYLTLEGKDGSWTGAWEPKDPDTNSDRLEIGPKPR